MNVQKDKEHFARTEKFVKEIQNLYFGIADYCAMLVAGNDFKAETFKFKDYPVINRQVDTLIKKMRESMQVTIQSGISSEWNWANENNDELVQRFFKDINLAPKKYMSRNLKALEAFQNRKTGGLNLSQRIWNYSNQYKVELEHALDVGIAEGRSAAELSRDIRKYLREPDKLFRKVRDKEGFLQLSKSALKYKPGAGVYRSSYKNAMRLTRTEINTAYREADYLRWQQLDFVVGVEVRRSNRKYDCDVCESLKGKYPKDFKFTQFHPQCRCFAIPILATEKELMDSIKTGEPIKSKNEVKGAPKNFNKWVEENKERIDRAKSKPYWMKDNMEFLE